MMRVVGVFFLTFSLTIQLSLCDVPLSSSHDAILGTLMRASHCGSLSEDVITDCDALKKVEFRGDKRGNRDNRDIHGDINISEGDDIDVRYIDPDSSESDDLNAKEEEPVSDNSGNVFSVPSEKRWVSCLQDAYSMRDTPWDNTMPKFSNLEQSTSKSLKSNGEGAFIENIPIDTDFPRVAKIIKSAGNIEKGCAITTAARIALHAQDLTEMVTKAMSSQCRSVVNVNVVEKRNAGVDNDNTANKNNNKDEKAKNDSKKKSNDPASSQNKVNDIEIGDVIINRDRAKPIDSSRFTITGGESNRITSGTVAMIHVTGSPLPSPKCESSVIDFTLPMVLIKSRYCSDIADSAFEPYIPHIDGDLRRMPAGCVDYSGIADTAADWLGGWLKPKIDKIDIHILEKEKCKC